MSKWSSIATPKEFGGWGPKDIHTFARALIGKTLCRLTERNSLLVRVMQSKYFANLTIAKWFRTSVKSVQGSIVWKALVLAFPMVSRWTTWRIGNGQSVCIGEDPWLEAGNNFRLYVPLIHKLKDLNISTLYDACVGFPQPRGRLGWKSSASLGLPLEMMDEWESYISLLCENFIFFG